MSASWKSMPKWSKVLVVCFAFLLVIGWMNRQPRPNHTERYGERGYSPIAPPAEGERRESEDGGDSAARSSLLVNYKAQYAQLQARAADCAQQMNEATQQQAAAAMNGQMYNPRPACEQYMPQIIAQEAFLETEMYKLQGGDPNATVRQVSGIAPPQYSGSYPSSGSGSSGSSTDPVDTWDRQAIRGTSLYTDETGTQRELATHSYYFRDRASGELIGSEQPYPPNNGRDYEVIQPQPQQ